MNPLPPDRPSPAPAPSAAGGRFESLDGLRGLLVVLMALDHASYFVTRDHPGEFWGVPPPRYDGQAAFLTRFVTHLAAPGFFFLMGASVVFLAAARRRAGWSAGRIARQLVTRGLLLVLLQQCVENPAWLLGAGGTGAGAVPGGGGPVMLHFGVLAGLGAAMAACAALLRAPAVVLGGVGVGAVVLTQSLTPGPDQAGTLFSPAVRLLVIPGHTNAWQVYYPFLPWVGVAAVGMAFGRAIQRDPETALRRAWVVGAACLLGFAAVRAAGGFGNTHPADGAGWVAFLAVTKYPPSLAFLLLTLGLDLVLLSAVHAAAGWVRGRNSPLTVFGQTALAFYLLHLYLYGLMGLFIPAGAPRPTLFVVWLLGLGVLYPACRRYRAFKGRTNPDSLWRLF